MDIIKCRCLQNGHEFDYYLLPDFSYGQWLLWTVDGKVAAFLNLLEEDIVTETSRNVKFLQKELSLSSDEKGNIFKSMIEFICDPIGGIALTTEHENICPVCGVKNINLGGYAHVSTSVELPVVTFSRWSSLTSAERFEGVRAEMIRRGLLPAS